MPNYGYSPLGAGLSSLGDSLLQMMLYRDEQKRRKMLDDVAARDRESLMETRKLNNQLGQAQLASLDEQRAGQAADRVSKSLSEGQDLDADTIGTLRAGKLGGLVGPGQQKPPRMITERPDDGSLPSTQIMPDVSDGTFRGRPEQIKAREDRERAEHYLSTLDPASDEARALQYELATDKNAPAGMFDNNRNRIAVGSFEDYVTRKYGDAPTADQITQARKVYGQADDRPYAPIVIAGAAGGPRIVDRGNGTSRAVLGDAGDPLGPAPTADMRNRAFASGRAEPVLAAIGELSEKINTGSGLLARLTGEAEKIAAKANYDDDVAEYNALIAQFTPLVARALGHVGVLTEQDVQSVREGFPKPGDSKSLRDRKVNRLMSLFKSISGDPMDPATATPPPAGPAQPSSSNDPLGIRR